MPPPFGVSDAPPPTGLPGASAPPPTGLPGASAPPPTGLPGASAPPPTGMPGGYTADAASAAPAAPAAAQAAAQALLQQQLPVAAAGTLKQQLLELLEPAPAATLSRTEQVLLSQIEELDARSLLPAVKEGEEEKGSQEFADFHEPPFEGMSPGNWLYICVDPSGLRLRSSPVYAKSAKAGVQVNFGEMVRVTERGKKENLVWLKLADNRGWAFERTNRQRMSEIIDVDLDENMAKPPEWDAGILISPRLTEGLRVMSRPFVSSTSAPVTHLHPGTPVVVLAKCKVQTQDGLKTFLAVVDDVHTQGWIPVLVEKKNSTAAYTVEGLPTAGAVSLWLAINPGQKAPVYLAPGRSDAPLHILEKCELLEVAPEKLVADELTFFRLSAGGWLCETNVSGTKPFTWVTRESHWWIYSVAARDGSVVRQLPNREKKFNTDKTLKRGQEVRVCEKVTYPDGDAFIRLEDMTGGWVPLMRMNGDLKMMAEYEIPPGVLPTEAVLGANPNVKKAASSAGLGGSLRRGMSKLTTKKQTASATE